MTCSRCGFSPNASSPTQSPFIERTARHRALTASNEAPLDSERAELVENVARAQEHSASLDHRIARVRATLDDLVMEKAAADEYAEQTQVILHPSRRIPSEVLAEVFAFFVDDAMATTFEEMVTGNFVDIINIHNGPMLLSRVSSHWRRTVMALPHLWANNINLNFDRNYNTTSIATSRLFAEVLSRTSNAKLQVTIYSTRDISDDRIFSALLVTCDRWQTAGMALRHCVFESMNSHITFDALESVRVHVRLKTPYTEVRRALASPSTAPEACALLCAPRLRSIFVDNGSIFCSLFAIDWEHITHFVEIGLGGPNEQDFHEKFPLLYFAFAHTVLRKMHHVRLEPCHHPPSYLGPSLEPFTNKGLCHLVLGKIGASNRDKLLQLADLPALEVMHFTDPAAHGEAFPKPLSPSVGNSIKELSVYTRAQDTHALVELLRTTPNLCTLKVCVTTCFDIGLLFKAIFVDAHGVVPSLVTLEVRGRVGVKVTMAFVEALRARGAGIHGVAALRKVVVDYSSAAEDAKMAFEGLRAQGLEGGLFSVA